MSHRRMTERRKKLARLSRIFPDVECTNRRAEHNGHWGKFDRRWIPNKEKWR